MEPYSYPVDLFMRLPKTYRIDYCYELDMNHQYYEEDADNRELININYIPIRYSSDVPRRLEHKAPEKPVVKKTYERMNELCELVVSGNWCRKWSRECMCRACIDDLLKKRKEMYYKGKFFHKNKPKSKMELF